MEENILNIYGIYEYGIGLDQANPRNDDIILYLAGLGTFVSYAFSKLFCSKPQIRNKVLPHKSECLITWEEIGIGDLYYQCDRCGQIYLCEKLDQWFEKNKNLTCPYCQTCSININHIYINK